MNKLQGELVTVLSHCENKLSDFWKHLNFDAAQGFTDAKE
jgi:hypothetical protein